MSAKVLILDHASILTRLRRMAYELYEHHYQEEALTLIGIDERGGFLAEQLVDLLAEISPLSLTLIHAHVDRNEGEEGSLGIEIDAGLDDLTGQAVVVVDDVLYTGSTMLNVVSILLQAHPKCMKTAVLIDRGHRLLPIAADITGLELATTINEHVSVEFDQQVGRFEAFLV